MPKGTRPKAIGIDFGTTNTAASVLDTDGKVRLLDLDPKASDPQLLRSLLYFPTRKEAFFGHEAIERYFERDMEGRFLQSVKRLLPNSDFQGTSIHGQFLGIEELVARFLTEARRRIETQLEMDVNDVPFVMGRPARYSADSGREGMAVVRFRKACELAGFRDIEFMEEPVAAAHSYSATAARRELVLVADLGGGTSDFTLMEIGGGKKNRALAVHGISMAGDALDSAFMLSRLTHFFGAEIRYQRPFSSNILTLPTSFVKLLPKWHHHAFLKEKSTWNFLKTLHQELVDPKNDKPYLDNLITLIEDNLGYALHQKVELLKCALSQSDSADFVFRSHPIKIEFPVTLTEYEKLLEPVISAIAAAAKDTLRQARVEASAVDALYFTGGTAKVPSIRAAVQALVPGARMAEQAMFTSVASGLAMSRA